MVFLHAFCPGVLPDSQARALTEVLVSGFSFRAGGLDTTAAAREVAPALSASVSQAVTQQFPLTSVAPAFTYQYNPALRVWEPSTGVPGPLFSERALTIGKGQFNFSLGYSFVEFDAFNGTDLHNLKTPGLLMVA